MGLHICYDLRLPADTPVAHVVTVLERLRAQATGPGVHITALFRFSLAHLQRKRAPGWTGLDRYFDVIAGIVLRTRDGIVQYNPADRDRVAALGFALHPGRGSEAATFGFVRPLVAAPGDGAENDDPGAHAAWYWTACCKTQYASIVSTAHLIRCHQLIVVLLDSLRAMGVGVTVRDETGYWETRSVDTLVREVTRMNRIVARLGGALADAMPDGVRPAGAIFEHPEFERLEMEGRRQDDESQGDPD